MLKYLKDIFSTILVFLLSSTVIPNILEYIQISSKFFLPLQIYEQLLDYPKLTYIVSPIHKSKFKDLNFFISSKDIVNKIPKIMIFVNKINNNLEIAKYLYSRLFEHILRKWHLNFITILKTRFLGDFHSSENQIWIYKKYTNMGINLQNIFYVIQFKISNYIILLELL